MLVFIVITLAGYALDRLTKLWIKASLPLGHSISVVGPYLSLTHVENAGAAFSILNGRVILFVVVAVVAAVAVLVTVIRRRRTLGAGAQAVLGMLMAGILGNLTDRLLFGHVTDFINFHFWPVFNMADSMVVVSVILLFLGSIRSERRD